MSEMPITTLVAATVPAASTAAELVRQARALNRVYQQTWRLEDLKAQICFYLRAIDLLCVASDGGGSFGASITPAPIASVSREPLLKEEDNQRTCAIGA